jgi:hypothetical protein
MNRLTHVGPEEGCDIVVGGFKVFERKLLDLAWDELLVKEVILKGADYPDMIVT